MGLSDQDRALRAVDALLVNDAATRELGMQVLHVGAGVARLQMTITSSMLNGHQTCQGGFLFTLADSCFAIACNSFNQVAVASSASIEFLRPAFFE